MRLLLASVILAGSSSLVACLDGGADRWSTPIDGQVMDQTRGSDIDSKIEPVDICGTQNLQPGLGEQTAADCVGGPNYPFGPCIDCGTQQRIVFESEVSSGMTTDPNTFPCSINLKKTGRCIRDSSNKYYCAEAEPDDEDTPCAGTVHPLMNQVLGGPH